MSRQRDDRGSITVETVLLAPLLVAMLMFVVHLGGLATLRLRLVAVADHSARAASLVHPERMAAIGRRAVLDGLHHHGARCSSFDVDVNVDEQASGAIVKVDIRCRVDPERSAVLQLLPRMLHVSSSEPVDYWRVDS